LIYRPTCSENGFVQPRSLQQQMYEVTGRTRAQRVTLAASLALCVALTWWLLWDGGLAIAGAWFGLHLVAGIPLRRAYIASALSIYFVRVLFTDFVFLKRGISWTEVFTIAPWVLCLYLFFDFCGGTNPAALGPASLAGVSLFALGSWINSYAEYQRHKWKRQPKHRGMLYTQGLFRYTRHPNYLGDLLSFTGLCFLADRWYTAIVPLLMLAGFVFVNVPTLDAHLQARYGRAFDEYARKTRKLIPFVY